MEKEKKTKLINVRVSAAVSEWMTKNKVSPTELVNDALAGLGCPDAESNAVPIFFRASVIEEARMGCDSYFGAGYELARQLQIMADEEYLSCLLYTSDAADE